jgi:hypothetical protein
MQSWIEGETQPRLFTLYATEDDPQDLTGSQVELLLVRSDGTSLDTSTALTVVDPGQGRLQYAPPPEHIRTEHSPMTAIFRVTDAQGFVSYFPSDGAHEWYVTPVTDASPRLTFRELRVQVLRWLDAIDEFETGSNLDRLVKLQLNDAAAARASEYAWPFMKMTSRITLVPGIRRYSLPSLGRLLYVWSTQSAQYATRVPDRHFKSANIRPDGSSGGHVFLPFELRGPVLSFLEDVPGDVLEVGFFRTPTKLIHPGDIPNLPYPHSRLLVWDALLDLKTYAQDLGGAPIWARKQDDAVRTLYQAYTDGQTVGELPQSIHG